MNIYKSRGSLKSRKAYNLAVVAIILASISLVLQVIN